MKINWGTGIVIAFGLFMTFILYFVFEVQSNSKYDNELVVQEYYKHDTKFSEEFDKLQNAADLSQKPEIVSTDEGVRIDFAHDLKNISGKVSFYRPSASKLDFETSIPRSGTYLLIPVSRLAGGQWDITLEWTEFGKTYMIKKEIYQ
ncbi:MAG: cytochrome C oxidase Cbb3 [Flavobacterium sp.]|uniref:FixH family protein n=1 Tax=Flavobacterium sp. TaxID=239 RepID=UPI0011FBCD17|nr:FixH family protein [Flavobacterium sp.]RZJ68682.1 MAG: cytochrome C oxidase Cbb3 [Flavobacterium sp.]